MIREWSRHVTVGAASVVALLSPQEARGQTPVGTLRGTVIAADSSYVSGASVTLSPGGRTVRTDAVGSFVFGGLAPQAYVVEVRAVGAMPDTTGIVLGAGQTQVVTIRLQAVRLRTVTVNAVRSALTRVADREQRGMGAVMYADEIPRIPLYDTFDLLQFSPRFALGNRAIFVYVDGRPIRDIRRDLPHRRDIAAIEAQRGYAGIREPDLWIPSNHGTTWGGTLILIWTVQYMAREQQRSGSR